VRDELVLTPLAFNRLLRWLDNGVESHGDTYLDMRRRLVSYFDQRGRPSPDELADETLNRIARTLEENGTIPANPPARYCYAVARFVLLEDLRRREHRYLRLDQTACPDGLLTKFDTTGHDPERTLAVEERRLECVERCLTRLKPEQRELILEYYYADRREKIERRRALAARLRITMNALSIRACRIRGKLESCVGSCLGKP
jgi:DNA-directed RNA polymerase specialized sigma24 family protein